MSARPVTGAGPAGISPRTVALFAVAVGVSVSNLYYVQPLLPEIHRAFGTSPGVAALAVTVAQAGYAAGLFALLPLGDVLERRRLVVTLSLVCAVALGLAAASPTFPVLLVALALTGSTSVVTHILVPYAATLARPESRGRVVGTVMGGLLVGVLLARAFAGVVAGATSWRVVYVLAAAAMAALALALALRLPPHREPVQMPYRALLGSLLAIFTEEPLLRRRALFGALSMAAFTTLWTTLAFLLAAPPFNFDSTRIGLFSLAGAAGAAGAIPVGRLADRGRSRLVTLVAAALLIGAWLPLSLGRSSITGLAIGVIALDLGCQAIHVTNQSVIYVLRPGARTRLNAVYMTCYFLGATTSSALAGALWALDGWMAVAALGAGIGAAALVLALLDPGMPPPATAGGAAQPPATAGTIESVSPEATGVSSPSRNRTSSSAT